MDSAAKGLSASPSTHHHNTSSKDEDLDHYLDEQLAIVDEQATIMQSEKSSLNPAAAAFTPAATPAPSIAASDVASGGGSIPAVGASGRFNPFQSARSNASANSFNPVGRDPTYAENPNPAFLRGPRLIPGRSTGQSVMEDRARARAAGPDPDKIPLYGSCHGMFYHPSTKLFTGDGPPRYTALRASGQGPCSAAMMAPRNPTANGKPITDQLHVQTKAFVDKSLEGFGTDGNVQSMYLGKPEGGVVQREEHEEQFKNTAAAKEEFKKKHEEGMKKMEEKEKEEEEHFKIVTGGKKGLTETTDNGEKKQGERVGGKAGGDAGVEVRDFAYDPIVEKKVPSKDTKTPLTMAEKLKKQFAKGL